MPPARSAVRRSRPPGAVGCRVLSATGRSRPLGADRAWLARRVRRGNVPPALTYRSILLATYEQPDPISSYDDLLRPFHEAEKPRRRWRIGTEAEKFGVSLQTGLPLPYEGEVGVLAVLEALRQRHGWYPEAEYAGGETISLRRGDSSITLEPGGQLELSGAPLETVHETCQEVRGHMAELEAISEDLGIAWLGVGFHPLATAEQCPWVPKLRYRVMRDYLPTRGSMSVDMMQRTATVQCNLDFADEQDAMRKLRLSLRLAPIVTAIFANSPWVEGRATGERSHRARVWLNMDPDRSGLLPFLWGDAQGSYRDYVEWALDVPMFLVRRGAKVIPNTGQTFRDYMRDGKSGIEATQGDWETHLNTLFPEARLKRTLEVRGADAQATDRLCALPALWKGLLYDAEALRKAELLVSTLDLQDVEAARESIADHALRAQLGGRELAEWANEVMTIASDGLGRLNHLSGAGKDERVHLEGLSALVKEGRCPADALLQQAEGAADSRARILELAQS